MYGKSSKSQGRFVTPKLIKFMEKFIVTIHTLILLVSP